MDDEVRRKAMETVKDELDILMSEAEDDIWKLFCKEYSEHDTGTGKKEKPFTFPIPIKVTMGVENQNITVKAETTVTEKKKISTRGSTASMEPELPLDGGEDGGSE